MIRIDMPIIFAENLTKKFKNLVAVAGVNLSIEESECFGLLGPNGAGKTTLIRMITAVSPPTTGKIQVAGRDIAVHSRETKAILGVVPQIDNLDEELTVFQNLTTFARYFSIPKKEAQRRSLEALNLFKLEDKRNSKLKELSGGMRRRLLIARGLINQPRILILDEPTIGLDPQSRHLVWQQLGELQAKGVTQLLCTQSMEEAALLCDRIAIMHQGKIVGQDTPRALIERYVGEEVSEIDTDTTNRQRIIRELTANGLAFVDMGDRIRVFRANGKIPETLDGQRIKVKPSLATLEDVFFLLTGTELG